MIYGLVIEGKPQPKERPRVYNGHGVTPPKTREYEKMVAWLWQMKCKAKLTGAVRMRCTFYLPIPPSWSKKKQEDARQGVIYPTVRPDIDNLNKIIMDALNEVAYLDDKQVVAVISEKRYSDRPRTEVVLEEL